MLPHHTISVPTDGPSALPPIEVPSSPFASEGEEGTAITK
jgi:hypothetical protein